MQEKIVKLKSLISEGREHSFYTSYAWNKVRSEVLKMDNYECQLCKKEGRYSHGDIVHHIHHLKDYPELALSIYDESGERNLITVCKRHHEMEHPESQRRYIRKETVAEERWD